MVTHTGWALLHDKKLTTLIIGPFCQKCKNFKLKTHLNCFPGFLTELSELWSYMAPCKSYNFFYEFTIYDAEYGQLVSWSSLVQAEIINCPVRNHKWPRRLLPTRNAVTCNSVEYVTASSYRSLNALTEVDEPAGMGESLGTGAHRHRSILPPGVKYVPGPRVLRRILSNRS